jgi:hypothetical protein
LIVHNAPITPKPKAIEPEGQTEDMAYLPNIQSSCMPQPTGSGTVAEYQKSMAAALAMYFNEKKSIKWKALVPGSTKQKGVPVCV